MMRLPGRITNFAWPGNVNVGPGVFFKISGGHLASQAIADARPPDRFDWAPTNSLLPRFERPLDYAGAGWLFHR